MGDNLGPNGLSRGCKVFCSRSKYPRIMVHEADEPNAPVGAGTLVQMHMSNSGGCDSAFPRHVLRPSDASVSSLFEERAQGMPGAGCTHGPPATKKSRRQSPQVSQINPAFPAQWLYGLYAFSPVHRACWPPSPWNHHPGLDPSVGRSGPRDFAVRLGALVSHTAASIASRFQRP
jgi:hypothetical protein